MSFVGGVGYSNIDLIYSGLDRLLIRERRFSPEDFPCSLVVGFRLP